MVVEKIDVFLCILVPVVYMVDCQLTDEEVNRMDEAFNVKDIEDRLEQLTDIVEEKMTDDMDDDDIEILCYEFATEELIGTGMPVSMDVALQHLTDFAKWDDDFSVDHYGGDSDLLEELSLEGDVRVDHGIYYAVQRLYGIKIYERLMARRSEIETLP